jgi:hypothetical protein
VLTPSGGGARRQYAPLFSLVAGTIVGGCLLGVFMTVIWVAVTPIKPARAGLFIAGLAVAALAMRRPTLRGWLPQRTCQVSAAMGYTMSLKLASFRWGIELGLGIPTLMVTPAFYALLGTFLAQERVLDHLLVGATYGAARGATIFAFALAKGRAAKRGHPAGTVGVGLRSRLTPLLVATILGLAVAATMR